MSNQACEWGVKKQENNGQTTSNRDLPLKHLYENCKRDYKAESFYVNYFFPACVRPQRQHFGSQMKSTC